MHGSNWIGTSELWWENFIVRKKEPGHACSLNSSINMMKDGLKMADLIWLKILKSTSNTMDHICQKWGSLALSL